MRTFRIYSLVLYKNVNYNHHVLHNSSNTYLSITRSLYLLITFIQFPFFFFDSLYLLYKLCQD